jgi:hypothetical protein
LELEKLPCSLLETIWWNFFRQISDVTSSGLPPPPPPLPAQWCRPDTSAQTGMSENSVCRKAKQLPTTVSGDNEGKNQLLSNQMATGRYFQIEMKTSIYAFFQLIFLLSNC